MQVYFTLLTSMGFTLQSFLLASSRTPFRSFIALLALPSSHACRASNGQTGGAWIADLGFVFPRLGGCLQGFVPDASSFRIKRVLCVLIRRCSLGFLASLGASPPAAMDQPSLMTLLPRASPWLLHPWRRCQLQFKSSYGLHLGVLLDPRWWPFLSRERRPF